MNIYDVLRKLVEARGFTDQERADSLRLLNDMERMAVLGTMAGSLAEQDHQCEPKDAWFPGSRECRICGKPLEPPLHSCIPEEVTSLTSGWGKTSTVLKCKICGKGM